MPDQPESTVHHGHRGFLEAWGRFLESFTDFTVEPEKLKDLGGDRVFVVADTRGRGADSGVEFTQHVASLWTLRNGKVLQVRFFRTPSEALAAAGLPR